MPNWLKIEIIVQIYAYILINMCALLATRAPPPERLEPKGLSQKAIAFRLKFNVRSFWVQARCIKEQMFVFVSYRTNEQQMFVFVA